MDLRNLIGKGENESRFFFFSFKYRVIFVLLNNEIASEVLVKVEG